MFDEPQVAVVRRKSVGHFVSVNDNHLGPGLCSFQDESHDEIRFDQRVVRPVRDPSKMDVQHLAFVNRDYSDCHCCAGESENLAYGTLRFGEMHIEYLLEMVLPFSFAEKHPALERLQLRGRQPTPLDIGARNPFGPLNPGRAIVDLHDDASRGPHLEAGQLIDYVAPA